MSRMLIVGNWKMYPTLSDAVVLAGSLRSRLETIQGVEVALAPPTPWLLPVIEHWKHKLPHVHWAAQNVFPEDQGAYTGETSAYFLKSLVRYAIIGHSERRRHLGEDDDLINQKVLACLRWRIRPILCVGEARPALNGDGGLALVAFERLKTELLEGLRGVKREALEEVVVAYEPVWAIGGDKAASADYAARVIAQLRAALIEKHGRAAEQVQFLYGGSVDTSNAGEFLREREIGGLLMGTASVKAKEFAEICQIASKINP